MNPFPTPVRRTDESAEYFDLAAAGKLMLRRCAACAAVRGPQDRFCPACHAAEYTAIAAEGGARLVSWCVVHRSPVPGLETPYVAATVECDEGPWVLLRLLEVDGVELRTGLPLRLVTAVTGDDGESIVAARPA